MNWVNLLFSLSTILVLSLTFGAWVALERRWLQFNAELENLEFTEVSNPEDGAPTTAGLANSSKSIWRSLRDWLHPENWSPEELNEMVLEVCGQLRSGTPVSTAWERTWGRRSDGSFGGVTEGNEPQFLLDLLAPASPGGTPLRSWRVENSPQVLRVAEAVTLASRFSQRTGAPLATVLERVVAGVTAETEGREQQREAFAGPRLSALVLTVLPVVGLFLGELVGVGSFRWLLGGGLGSLATVVGGALLATGWWVSRRLIIRAEVSTELPLEAALNCDLVGAALKSGASIPGALRSLGEASGDSVWSRVGAELVLGAPWAKAWDPLPTGGDLLCVALRSGWEDGVPPLLLLEHVAVRARDSQAATARLVAAKLAVKLVLPLGLFLLPAFVLLGILPVAVTLLSGQLPGLGVGF